MRVRLLGPVDVIVGDEVRPVPGVRRKAVLAVLALSVGEIVSTERLIEVVWDGKPPSTAANTLQSHVSALRHILGSRTAIVARPPGYVLDLPDDGTDVQVALRLIAEAERSPVPARGAEQLRAALSQWRGDPLSDVTGLSWLDGQAIRLATVQLDAVQALTQVRLALGEHAQLLPELAELARLHPYRERVHGQLMLALYRTGRPAEALAVYDRLARSLVEELGLDPDQEVRELRTAIVRQDPALDGPVPDSVVVTGPPAGRVPRQLPAPVAGFTGRARQLAELDEILTDAATTATVVISAVSGTAGVGKTALAVHWAHQVADRFPDGQLYANLHGFGPAGTHVPPADAIRGFLTAFDIAPGGIPAGLDAQAALYRSVLAGKRVLVVLDNARDAEQVRPLLPGTASCLVLITSRNQLGGLIAADGARPLPVDLLSPDEATDLLVQRLGKERLAAEPGAVADIIERCARLPLALSVVAARAATHPGFALRALADQLSASHDRLDALGGGDAATDVRAVLSWSYRQLQPAAARLFRLLCLHPGPEIGEAATASLSGLPVREARQLIGELVDTHLVQEHAPGRYAYHDLLRAYAAELVDPSDVDGRAATARLLDHYLHTAATAARVLDPSRDPITLDAAAPGTAPEPIADLDASLAWFEAEHQVLLDLVQHTSSTGWDTHTWKLAWAIADYFRRKGHRHDWAATGMAGLAAAQRDGDSAAQARMHRIVANAYLRLGSYDDADHHLRSALDLLSRLGDPVGQAHAYNGLVELSGWQGRDAEALDHAQRALVLYREAGHRVGEANTLNALGWYHAQLGAYEEALVVCAEGLAVFQDLDDHYGAAGTWDSLGYAHHHLGRHGEAVACYEQALDGYRRVGDRFYEADVLKHLGDTHLAAGDVAAARAAWTAALSILDELNHSEVDVVRAKLATLPR